MKKILLIVLALGVIGGIVFLVRNKEFVVPVVSVPLPSSEVILLDNVEGYLRANIATLSPVKAVLGGTWYVTDVTIDLSKKSGEVTYEDGHIEEKRDFTYTNDSKNEITNLTIK
ncbi:MAG: hypothetical protein KBC17_02445 [Candidatus Pacebacteria bacterium]|nr:hypothetical protein [Candidatus Paceibacterota bacterium]